jgi:formylglycine-generating enzyme required for sulfatase activity
MKNIKGVITFTFFCLVVSYVHSQEVPFDRLNLTGSALYAATKIKEKFPNVVFTGGTRTLDSQAKAVAQNIYRSSNSGWVGATYTDSAFIRKLNKAIIDNWASIKGNESLILQTVNNVFNSDNAGARSMSKHLSGYAFDLRVNCVNYNELNSFLKTLPGFSKFLTKEGGLDVWHIEFNEAPIPTENDTSQNNFQATHRVVTNDRSNLRIRNGQGFNAAQIGSLGYGSYVKVLNTGDSAVDSDGNRGNWAYVITPDGKTGWCFGAYLQAVTQTPSRPQYENMVYVPGGTFTMGGTMWDDEKPIHTVTVQSFRMGKYPVTQKEWKDIMGNNPSVNKGDNRPVEMINWYQAVEYCNKLSQREELTPAYTINGTMVTWDRKANGYRLPTEAEWEYAAKGGKSSPGKYIYSGSNNVDEVAWYNRNSAGLTQEVGKKKSNGLGLYDMSGNVWEFCWDWFDRDYYGTSPANNPTGASSGISRSARGGSIGDSADNIHTSRRGANTPAFRAGHLGFRIVCQ